LNWLRRFLQGTDAQGATAQGDPEEIRAVEAVLAELRPALALDGGDVRLIAVEAGWVCLRFERACQHCAASAITLHSALEPRLRERLPWVQGVRAVGG
jgi:Fe-S cluster biogenesis protein NfuA